MAARSDTLKTYDRYGKRTGFKDWCKVEEKYFTFMSADQFALIQQTGDVHWLTTWMKDDINHSRFEPKLGLTEPLPDIRPSFQQRFEAEYLYGWWKAGWFYVWIKENADYIREYDRVLWVDDDHYRTYEYGVTDVRDELAHYGTELHTISPEPVWRREDIEKWL